MAFTITQSLPSYKSVPYLGLVSALGLESLEVTYTLSGLESVSSPYATVTFITTVSGLSGEGQFSYTFEYSDLSNILLEAEDSLKTFLTGE